ncbi:MAG: hypothetical protein ABJ275_02400 [Maricaulaceae bacterium]
MSTLVNCNLKISELIAILKQEMTMLSKGRIDGLDDIVRQKRDGMAELVMLTAGLTSSESVANIAPQMKKLKRLADENGLMLKSVLNGLRSARKRLQALQNQQAQVGAYNRTGGALYLTEESILSEKKV